MQATETAVPLGTQTGGQQVRNLLVTTLINGVPTPVLMQVIAIADISGNLLDLGLASRSDLHNQLLVEMRRELMIQNELLVQGLGLSIDLDREYRNDRIYDVPTT